MRKDQVRRFAEALDVALTERRVVQAWLGYGEVLFVGFGNDVLSPTPQGDHPVPPYELQTKYCDWELLLADAMVSTSESGREIAVRAVGEIVGLRVARWMLDRQSAELTIYLERDYVLRLKPLRDEDVSEEDAWCIRLPHEQYWVARCNGDIYEDKGFGIPG